MNDTLRSMTASCYKQLAELGIKLGTLHRNLSVASLVEAAIHMREGVLSKDGALTVYTGKYTGRSPDDRYIVDDEVTHHNVDWGKVNHPISKGKFELLFNRLKEHIQGKEFFVFDGFVGADIVRRMPIRVITDKAWHSLFATQIFIRPTKLELENHKPEFTLLSANNFKARPELEGTNTETFIIINFSKKIVIIGSTSYAGEIKKAMFSIMNYMLPAKGVFPMHCSANVGGDGEAALFFGLSGTGKTTLSADPERRLIGDDEHGWSGTGIFNFEGGCYAKCINLEREREPQIWNAIKFGAVMENVVIDDDTRVPNFSDSSITENTRAAYPLDFIPNTLIPSIADHPKVMIFLTADAFGVLPPVTKLTKEGAMYHFMSGYTSKLAGTERGITEPKETFSQCFGAPFMLLPAEQYAQMLGEKISRHRTRVYLVNTGWFGGPYGVGRRISLAHTRAMIKEATMGNLENVSFTHDCIFNLEVPVACTGVPSILLNPANNWSDKDKYNNAAKRLAALFVKNFEKFKGVSEEIKNAGPAVN